MSVHVHGGTRSDTPTVPDALLTRKQVAATLALSPSMIGKLADAGAIPVVRIGRAVRFRASDVDEFVRARTVPTTDRAASGDGGSAKRGEGARHEEYGR
jgi:excisionase family DNA binding protein